MKKRLLKPPSQNNDIYFEERFFENLEKNKRPVIGTCHQPYFFGPGVSIKFFLPFNYEAFSPKIILHDLDKINLNVCLPGLNNQIDIKLFNSEIPLVKCPNLNLNTFIEFFNEVQLAIENTRLNEKVDLINNFKKFKNFMIANNDQKYLKDSLSKALLFYHGIKLGPEFLSDYLNKEQYKEFFMKIYMDLKCFKDIFNASLIKYKNEYKFRYKNYPFSPLSDGELPFWILRKNKRERVFKKDINLSDFNKYEIYPKAYTLTLFLRKYFFDIFIHGIGGGNYERIVDMLFQEFYFINPTPYIVTSGTFHIAPSLNRNLPYFLFDLMKINKTFRCFINKHFS